jgi:hypothetical protein
LVVAQAKDEHGDTSSWSNGLTVVVSSSSNQPPDTPGTPIGPATLMVGQSGTFSSSTTDPEGHQVQYMFDWDHNVYSVWSSLVSSGQSVSMSNAWSSPGTCYVMVKARDEHLKESSWSDALEVTILPNDKPIKPDIKGSNNGKAGEKQTYTLKSVDPDGDSLHFWVDWDDGNEFETEMVNSGESIDVEHTWGEEGTYMITVIAYDEYGLESEPATLSVTMPRNKPYNDRPFLRLLHNFLENYPILYQLLQRVLHSKT